MESSWVRNHGGSLTLGFTDAPAQDIRN